MGSVHTALLERADGEELEARLPENSIVRVRGEAALVGRRAEIVVTEARSYVMFGDIRRLLD